MDRREMRGDNHRQRAHRLPSAPAAVSELDADLLLMRNAAENKATCDPEWRDTLDSCGQLFRPLFEVESAEKLHETVNELTPELHRMFVVWAVWSHRLAESPVEFRKWAETKQEAT